MKKLLTLLLCLGSSLGFAQTNLYFPPNTANTWDTLSAQSLGWCPERIDSLYQFLEDQDSKAFVLLKDGKIVLEQYFNNFGPDSLWYWASAGKGLTSFLTGLAQREGHLSLSDYSSQYLGQGWTDCDSTDEAQITIWNQLTMTTGLDDGVPDNFCTLDTCLQCIATPGSRWAYHNAPYTLLDEVIRNATGQSLNVYMASKLRNPIGMDGLFVPSGYNNVYFSTARSMARFGLLMLNRGVWNGTDILQDSSYFRQMTTTSQNLNLSYGYLWWLNGKSSFMAPGYQIQFPLSISPSAPADMYAALGSNGQLLNIVPSQGLVWLRMGNAPSSNLVPFAMNDSIWQYINNFALCPTAQTNLSTTQTQIQVFPNPNQGLIHLNCQGQVPQSIRLFDLQGRLLQTWQTQSSSPSLEIETQAAGLYLLEISLADQSTQRFKIMRQ